MSQNVIVEESNSPKAKKRTAGESQHDKRIVIEQMMKIMESLYSKGYCPVIRDEFSDLFRRTKVFECVPVSSFWSSQSILGEMKRIGGNYDLKVVQGCLDGLKDDNLIIEGKAHLKGFFKRTQIKDCNVKKKEADADLVEETNKIGCATEERNPLDIFSEVDQKCEEIIIHLGLLKEMINNKTIEMGILVADFEAKSARFDQIQKLLKGG